MFTAQSRGLEPAPEPIWAQSEFLQILETCQNSCSNITKECSFSNYLSKLKVFRVNICVFVSIVPVITVANCWRMFHRNKVSIVFLQSLVFCQLKVERKEVIWNLKCFDPWLSLSSLCYVEQSEARVKLHGAPGLAETMLMTQNRFKLYNSPTVKTRSCVQQELQSPNLLLKNNRKEDWKILIISLDDLIWSWFVCFSKQEGAAQKEAHQNTSPSNKNIIFYKKMKVWTSYTLDLTNKIL